MKEALKLALEALEDWHSCFFHEDDAIAITAIKKALREHAMYEVQRLGQEIQPEQEPVVWMYQDKSTHEVRFQKHMRDFVDHGATYETPLYTTPPQRTWVGLTPDDFRQLEKETTVNGYNGDYCPTWDLIEAVEEKLKEKNT